MVKEKYGGKNGDLLVKCYVCLLVFFFSTPIKLLKQKKRNTYQRFSAFLKCLHLVSLFKNKTQINCVNQKQEHNTAISTTLNDCGQKLTAVYQIYLSIYFTVVLSSSDVFNFFYSMFHDVPVFNWEALSLKRCLEL